MKICMPEGGGSNALESALLANGGCGNQWNNPFIYLVWMMFAQRMWGNNNCENNAQISQLQEQLSTSQGQQLLMDAIKGNSGALHELASTINCDDNSIKTAISAVQNTLGCVGSNLGQQIITQGYESRINNLQQSGMLQNNFAQMGYRDAENTCAIKQNATDNTNRVIAKLDAIEDSRKDREIVALTAQLTAANSRAERQAELAPIYKALADIECKQPSTATVPYPQLTAIPTYQLYGGYTTNGGFL